MNNPDPDDLLLLLYLQALVMAAAAAISGPRAALVVSAGLLVLYIVGLCVHQLSVARSARRSTPSTDGPSGS